MGHWALQTPAGSEEDRLTAVERMKQWINQGGRDTVLELNRLNLGTLPDNLPPGVQHLDVSDNNFYQLPDQLSPTLTTLIASNNHLTSLPESLPNALKTINANVNQIRKLPERLPCHLKSLELHSNFISSLPETLPDSIEILKLSGNDFKEFPQKLPASLTELNIASNELTSLPANLPPHLGILNMTENSLTILPENLPATIRRLAVDGNQLTGLPNTLPENLQELSALKNQIVALPDELPPHLKRLLLQDNKLTVLPNNLPDELEEINVSDNQITELTSFKRLPELRRLNLRGNRLTNLPADVFQLSEACRIELETNAFSDGSYNGLEARYHHPEYSGPEIIYQERLPEDMRQAGTIVDEVTIWREAAGGQPVAAVHAVWQEQPTPSTHLAFAMFLARLHDTSEYKNPAMRRELIQRINVLLDRMEAMPDLRHLCFANANDATEQCTDRTALRLIYMEEQCLLDLARIDVNEGKYDSRPKDLIDLCKGVYRLKILSEEAEDIVKRMRDPDPVEVHLAYILKFADEFALPVQVRSMQFAGLSQLTDADFDTARRKLSSSGLPADEKIASDDGCLKYLSSAPLMTALLKRVVPQLMITAVDKAAQDTTARTNALYAQLEDLNLNEIEDAARAGELGVEFDRVEFEELSKAILPVLLTFFKQSGISATF